MNISDCMGCRHREEIPIPECCKKCENHKNYDLADIILTENGGLQEHQRQLKMAENSILFVGSKLSQIKIDRMNARNIYDDLLSTAKISAIAEYDLKPSNQTIINAYATANEDVRSAKQDWLNKKAIEIKAKDRLDQLQGQRDTLKALVKSEHSSY